jgi:hypothetical protein
MKKGTKISEETKGKCQLQCINKDISIYLHSAGIYSTY